jgi:UDP-4-amino-4,6-dideoxy-N-acetyl-beta-L-altrosamine transaminase
MSMIPYSRQAIGDADIAAVVEVLRSDYLTQGPAIPRFEQAFAQRHGARHAIATCNATAALHIGCLALGVGPGDRVWTSPNSFVASANCALYCGAEADFVDIDPASRNMSVAALAEKLRAAEASGRLPKVVVPVDFSGLPADLREIRELADRYGFAILEDASHATGAEYLDRPVGSGFAEIAVFSFHPVKIITTGEGGLCLTDDDALAQRLGLFRSHGVTRDPALMGAKDQPAWYYEQVELGFNYRMTDIQAALGSSQLGRLAELRSRRDALTRRYDDLLANLPLTLPVRPNDRHSSHHLYVVELENGRARDAVFDGLRARNILANLHYYPIHLQPYYRALGFGEGDFPNAERYARRAITLPLFPTMTDEQQDAVVAALRDLIGH